MATVSAKIPDKLRRKARMHHIKISQVVRKAIGDEVRKTEEEKLPKDLGRLGSMLQKNVSSAFFSDFSNTVLLSLTAMTWLSRF